MLAFGTGVSSGSEPVEVMPAEFVDVVANVVVVALAAGLFDDEAEEEKAVVAVLELAAGLEAERTGAEELDVVLEGAQFEAVRVELGTEEVPGASGVGEQILDGDLCGDVLVRIVGEEFAERIVERELALLCELKNGDGGEHLVHGADAETGIEGVGGLVLAVGETVGLGKDWLALAGEENIAGEGSGGRVFLEFCLEGGDQLGLAEVGRGIRRARNGADSQRGNGVRLGGIDLEGQAGELVGVAFLHEGDELCRRGGVLNLAQIEAAGAVAEVHVLVDILCAGWEVLLEEGEKSVAVAVIEGVEPSGALMGGRSVGQRGLGQATGAEGENEQEKANASHGRHNTSIFVDWFAFSAISWDWMCSEPTGSWCGAGKGNMLIDNAMSEQIKIQLPDGSVREVRARYDSV